MEPTLFTAQTETDQPGARIGLRQLFWLITRICRYRRTLLLGVLATIAFAALHTVSIGAAFPVIKILLEDEGLSGWTDRTVSGKRLGVAFAPVADSDSARALSVDSDSQLYSKGLRDGDYLRATDGRTAAQLLHDVARLQSPGTVNLAIDPNATPENRESEQAVDVTPQDPGRSMQLLLRSISLLPVDADQNKLRTLVHLLVAMVLTVLIANVFRYVGEVLIAKAVLRAMMRLRTDLYARTLQLPMSFFAAQPVSDIVGRFVQDVQEIQRGMLVLLSKATREPLRAIFILGLALAIDWRITVVITAITPVAVIVFWRVGKSVKKSNRKLLMAYGAMIGALTASLQNLRVVKAYTAEEIEQEKLLQVDRKVFKQQLKLVKLQAFVSPMIETVAILTGSCLMVWFASRVLQDSFSISKFGGLGVTLSMLFDPLRKLTDVYVRIQRSTAGADRIFHVLTHPTESDLSDGAAVIKPLERAIEFVDVSFTYPGAATPALSDINLTIKKGETIAVVGPNGCGKTTLVSMLTRFFDPDSGRLLFDELDIRGADLQSLRRQIGLVTQDAVVFAGTPVENIGYGQSQLDRNRAQQAARAASADEFIRAIPGGYQAALGERGSTLSGGQRQRLAIARAMFRDAPILIFDEATSQIDSESEQKIQTVLQTFAQERTTLVVAHRLSTIQFADRIVVMDAGRIIDVGTHLELFTRCPLYHSLCETQFISRPTAQ